MELALNLFWLVLAATGFGLWLRQRRDHRRRALRSRERAAGLLALTCALFLVFPVISISDDLRGTVEFLGEPTADQTLAQSCELQKRLPLGESPSLVDALARPAAETTALPTIGFVFIPQFLPHEFDLVRPATGRSPPQA